MQPQMRSSLGQTHCQLLFANGYHALGQVVVVFREEAHGEHDVVDVVEYRSTLTFVFFFPSDEGVRVVSPMSS